MMVNLGPSGLPYILALITVTAIKAINDDY